MSDVVRNIVSAIRGEISKHRNRPFLEAAMAVSAYVAMADGKVSFSERTRLDTILETLEELRIYSPHDAVDMFNTLALSLRDNPDLGNETVFESIQEFAAQPHEAELLVRVGLAVAHADGAFTTAERERLSDVCKALGLQTAAFQL